MEQEPEFNPFHSLIFLTNRVGRLLASRIREEVEEELANLMPHMGVLVDLWMKDGIRQRELAVSLIKDKGTIARSLDVLERENAVVRVPDAADRRNKRIYLTHRGRDLRRRLLPHAEEVMARATEGLDEEALAACRAVLVAMYHQLNREG